MCVCQQRGRDTTHLPAGATTAQRFQESLVAAKEGEAMGLARCAELEAEVQQLRWVGGAVRYHGGLFCFAWRHWRLNKSVSVLAGMKLLSCATTMRSSAVHLLMLLLGCDWHR